MDIKLRNEINRLTKTREDYHQTYVQNLEIIEDKIAKLDVQIELTDSNVKRGILEKQRIVYQKDVRKIDSTMESTTNLLNKKIESIEQALENIEKEKESFDFNIKKLRNGIINENTGEIFDMFSSVVNALEILNRGRNEIDQKSEHSS
jgi:phage-related tail protein